MNGNQESFYRRILDDLGSFDLADFGDLQSIADWPYAARIFILGVGMLVGGAFGYWLFLAPPLDELRSAAERESAQRVEFTQKAALAAQLEPMTARSGELDRVLTTLLRQLPSSAEVPSLVDDITATGLGSGLEFSRIQLQKETPQTFFYELPIEIELVGNYHDFGTFVSGVAGLGRIVTLHDFVISAYDESDLSMRLVARTYRYDEEGSLGQAGEENEY